MKNLVQKFEKKHTAVRKKNKIDFAAIHGSRCSYSALDFYQLRIGDEFVFKGKKYKKVSDGRARHKNKLEFFWTMTTVKLPKPCRLDELHEKYPITAYGY